MDQVGCPIWIKVADALTALALDEVNAARTIVDLGSGAGVPALPLAAALPAASVTALDAVGKKVDWTTATATTMGLSNVTGVHARAIDPEHPNITYVGVQKAA